jgi:hypothetical protein
MDSPLEEIHAAYAEVQRNHEAREAEKHIQLAAQAMEMVFDKYDPFELHRDLERIHYYEDHGQVSPPFDRKSAAEAARASRHMKAEYARKRQVMAMENVVGLGTLLIGAAFGIRDAKFQDLCVERARPEAELLVNTHTFLHELSPVKGIFNILAEGFAQKIEDAKASEVKPETTHADTDVPHGVEEPVGAGAAGSVHLDRECEPAQADCGLEGVAPDLGDPERHGDQANDPAE